MALVISVSALNLRVVPEPVLNCDRLKLPPAASRVPAVRSSVPDHPLQSDAEFAARVPVRLSAAPS